MELKYLYTVKKIIETGSYQSAAAALNYAQSTITFQVKQLENELKIKLFEKYGSRMELTQEGREILPRIDCVLSSVDELLNFNKDDKLHGRLTIALPESLVTYKLQPVFKAFKEQAPDVKLSLKVMNCFAIYDEMVKGNIDIAVHYDVNRYPESYEVKTLGVYPIVLLASPEASGEDIDFITQNQRKTVCHIQNDPNALFLKLFHRYLKTKNIILETQLEVWSIEAIKGSVMSNLGVAMLPRFTVERELEQGLLKEIQTEMNSSSMTAICAYNKNKLHSSAMKLFLQILDEHFPEI